MSYKYKAIAIYVTAYVTQDKATEMRRVTVSEIHPGNGLPAAIERQTYTIEEAAKILGICRTVAYRPGVLPTVKIAGRRLVPKQALEQLLANTA